MSPLGLVGLSLLFACTSPGATGAQAANEDLDPRLAAALDEASAAILEWNVPGAAITVVDHGEVSAVGLGVREYGDPLPVGPDTLFRIGSISKMFTGALALQQVEEGNLDLDAPASDVLGDLELRGPWSFDDITLRQLLSHSSGLQGTGVPDTCDTDRDALERVLTERSADWSLWSPPGALYNYANGGFGLSGLAVQRASGENFLDLAQQRLLDPAGMETATYDADEASAGDHALGYTMDMETGRPMYEWDMYSRACGAIWPSGALIASARDMGQLASVLLDEGDPWLSPEGFYTMTHEGWAFSESSSYGFGVQRTSYRGHVGYTHSGAIWGYLALIWVLPEDDLAVVVMVNADHRVVTPPEPWTTPTQLITRMVLDRYLGLDNEPFDSSVRPVEDWGRYVGTYQASNAWGTLWVELRDGELVLHRLGLGDVKTLIPYSKDSFHYAYSGSDGRSYYQGISFQEGEDGQIAWLVSRAAVARRAGEPAAGQAPETWR